jgi:hypothetical protein
MEIFQETVNKYKTADGNVFDTEEEAKAHETELKACATLIKLHNGKRLDKDDIKEFFNRCKCQDCPFMVECHNMQDETRKHTTDTLTLCDVILFSV